MGISSKPTTVKFTRADTQWHMPEIKDGKGIENINLVISSTFLKIRAFEIII